MQKFSIKTKIYKLKNSSSENFEILKNQSNISKLLKFENRKFPSKIFEIYFKIHFENFEILGISRKFRRNFSAEEFCNLKIV